MLEIGYAVVGVNVFASLLFLLAFVVELIAWNCILFTNFADSILWSMGLVILGEVLMW